jgi:hypothetical protein
MLIATAITNAIILIPAVWFSRRLCFSIKNDPSFLYLSIDSNDFSHIKFVWKTRKIGKMAICYLIFFVSLALPFKSAAESGVVVSTDEGVFCDRPSFVAPAMLAVPELTGLVDVVSWAGPWVAVGALFDAGGGDNGLPE